MTDLNDPKFDVRCKYKAQQNATQTKLAAEIVSTYYSILNLRMRPRPHSGLGWFVPLRMRLHFKTPSMRNMLV